MNDEVTGFLARAAEQPAELTISQLLAIWGARYRDYDTVGRIQQDLAAVGLHCEPPFTEGAMSTVVRIGVGVPESETPPTDEPDASEDQELVLPHASLRVGDISSATNGITYVRPDAALADAQAIMIRDNFSQLAVMTGPSALRGTVSWDTIARAKILGDNITLADAIDPYPKVVHARDELFAQLTTIYDAGYVFVRDDAESVCGIVTTADLSDQFRLLTEPFFQLGEIEQRLRRCIQHVFPTEDLQCVANRRTPISSVEDMTFGQYVQLLRDNARWNRLKWQISADIFIHELNEVRKIRNGVMHFSTKSLDQHQEKRLRGFLSMMRYLDPQP